MYAAPYPIDGPQPAAPRHSLITTVRVVDEPDDRWVNGVDVHPYPTTLPATHDPCATGSAITTKGTGSSATSRQFGSYVAYVPIKCSTLGWRDEAFRARAEQILAARESGTIEAELMFGTRVPTNPYLTKNLIVTPLNASAATNLMNGLALLETAIAATQQAGVIHATPAVAVGWCSQNLVTEDNGILRSVATGTPIVVGTGYTGAGSAGGTPLNAVTGTQQWVVATGPLQIRRSGVFINPEPLSDATDRLINEVVVRAERYYNVSWDATLCSAVKIDRCQAAC